MRVSSGGSRRTRTDLSSGYEPGAFTDYASDPEISLQQVFRLSLYGFGGFRSRIGYGLGYCASNVRGNFHGSCCDFYEVGSYAKK